MTLIASSLRGSLEEAGVWQPPLRVASLAAPVVREGSPTASEEGLRSLRRTSGCRPERLASRRALARVDPYASDKPAVSAHVRFAPWQARLGWQNHVAEIRPARCCGLRRAVVELKPEPSGHHGALHPREPAVRSKQCIALAGERLCPARTDDDLTVSVTAHAKG